MSFDPRFYRNKDGIGMPADDQATNATSAWTVVALLKGVYTLLSGGITVTLPGTAATAAKQDTGNTSLTSIDGHVDGIEALIGTTNTALSTIDGHVDGLEALVTSSNTKLDTVHTDLGTLATQTTLAAVLAKLNASVAVTGAFFQATQPVSGTVAATQSGTWNVTVNVALPAGSAIIGKVGIDQTAGQNLVKQVRSTTGAQSIVAGSASSVTILASNASRLGASVYNDSTAILYLLLASGSASTTVHTVQMPAGYYFEVPAFYTGIIVGIWASATGSARVTELT